MAVDKNLFLYDLAVVAIMKNEAPYVKEWLDYHLLAGVDHFYIYDNESPDNLKEVLQPYIDARIVTYTFYPGKAMQNAAYNDAVNKYKFFCRYIAFIDGDEFIFPQNNKSIVEVTEEILPAVPNAGSLEISWQLYGSNGQEKADYSKGVLERFTRRAENNEKSNSLCKTILDPRKVRIFLGPHSASFFENFFPFNEKKEMQTKPGHISPPLTEKIVINHYHCKSWEEYQKKSERGDAYFLNIKDGGYNRGKFDYNDKNEVFDDSILKYRENRISTLIPDGGGRRKMCLKVWRQASRLTIRNCA